MVSFVSPGRRPELANKEVNGAYQTTGGVRNEKGGDGATTDEPRGDANANCRRRWRRAAAAALASIPEHVTVSPIFAGTCDEQDTCHRSPVSLATGYRPVVTMGSLRATSVSTVTLAGKPKPESRGKKHSSPKANWHWHSFLAWLVTLTIFIVAHVFRFVHFPLATQGSATNSSVLFRPASEDFAVLTRSDIAPPPPSSTSSQAPAVTSPPPVVVSERVERVPDAEEERPYVVKALPKDVPQPEAKEPTQAGSERSEPAISAEVTAEPPPEVPAVTAADVNETEAHPLEDVKANASDSSAGTNKTEQDIPSFSEWTQKALLEEQKKKKEEKGKKKQQQQQQQQQQQHQTLPEINGTTVDKDSNGQPPEPLLVTPAPTKVLKKNFASTECGAKVVGSNPESNGAKNVISSSRDEYMMNKCGDKIWFAVELCESIKAMRLELANFELYSSVPNEFRVWMSNVYPAKEKDWELFGQFSAEDTRGVQTFHSTKGVFGKYAMVEVLSYHGEEHYCLVSHFRIFGIPEIELIHGDEDDDEDDDGSDHYVDDEDVPGKLLETTPPPPPVTTEMPPEPSQAEDSDDSIVSLIKEKIGRFVGVFRPRWQTGSDVDESSFGRDADPGGRTLAFSMICPDCDQGRRREVHYLLANGSASLSETLNVPALRHALEGGVCGSLGFNESLALPSLCGSSQQMEFYRTLFGTARTIAMCNVLAIRAGLITSVSDPAGSVALVSQNDSEDLPANASIGAPDDGQPKDASKNESSTSDDEGLDIEYDDAQTVSEKSDVKQPSPDVSNESKAIGTKRGHPASDLKEPPPVVHVPPSAVKGGTGTDDKASEASNGQQPTAPTPPSAPASRESAQSPWQKLSNKIKVSEDINMQSLFHAWPSAFRVWSATSP